MALRRRTRALATPIVCALGILLGVPSGPARARSLADSATRAEENDSKCSQLPHLELLGPSGEAGRTIESCQRGGPRQRDILEGILKSWNGARYASRGTERYTSTVGVGGALIAGVTVAAMWASACPLPALVIAAGAILVTSYVAGYVLDLREDAKLNRANSEAVRRANDRILGPEDPLSMEDLRNVPRSRAGR